MSILRITPVLTAFLIVFAFQIGKLIPDTPKENPIIYETKAEIAEVSSIGDSNNDGDFFFGYDLSSVAILPSSYQVKAFIALFPPSKSNTSFQIRAPPINRSYI